jgi:hypothetical protein
MVQKVSRVVASPVPYLAIILLIGMIIMIFVDIIPIAGGCLLLCVYICTVLLCLTHFHFTTSAFSPCVYQCHGHGDLSGIWQSHETSVYLG